MATQNTLIIWQVAHVNMSTLARCALLTSLDRALARKFKGDCIRALLALEKDNPK